ncbi:hypothetical protein JCM17960_22700 [Magnetospira thiophila]
MKLPSVILILAFVVSGCVTADLDNPLSRKLGWFGYLNGEDLRPACGSGQEVYRFVYNADYENQVRTYDLEVRPDGGGRLSIHVFGPATVAQISVETGATDLMAPWKGQSAQVELRPEDVQRLRAAWDSGPAPEGLEMTSEQFYWITGRCLDGTYQFNAFLWPSERFQSLAFDDLLWGWDFTDIAVALPHPPIPDIQEKAKRGIDPNARFRLRIGQNGLWTLGQGL